MGSAWEKFLNIDYKQHLLLSLVVRIILVIYGIHHDQISKVKYTDIDYKVFTDASRHYLEGNSPFDRHTYRYSPLVALILIPNITIHHSFGKILFCCVDILVALLIRLIVKDAIKEYDCYRQKNLKKSKLEDSKMKKPNPKTRKKLRQSNKQYLNVSKAELESKNYVNRTADVAMLAWLYNPMTIAIGTRGNCDSVAGFLVLLTLYFLQCKRCIFISGLIHGLSIHFRLYPIIYSLTYFMFVSKFSFYSTEDRRKNKEQALAINDAPSLKKLKNIENTLVQSSSMGGHRLVERGTQNTQKRTIFKKKYLLYLLPNFDQLKLVSGCLLSLSFLTWYFHHLFGYKFLYETYLYHFLRKDPKHNFSLYFYLQYLTAWVKNIGLWQKTLMVLPQLVLLLVLSVRYGLNRVSLNFSILTQTIVMVIYNGVLTSQYFVWIMAVLPLCMWQIKLTKTMGFTLLLIWYIAQGVWLLPAYLLEFQGQNTFLYIWIQSVSFFCANIAILGRLIMYFMPLSEKIE